MTMIRPKRDNPLFAYIHRMRNVNKRFYALEYAAWLQCGEQGDEPEPRGLSYMGAQAVRMELRECLRLRAAHSGGEG